MKEINKVLVLWYGWVLWTVITANLYTNWVDVIWVWKKKLENLDKSVFINNTEYQLPVKQYELPKDINFDLIFIATKVKDTIKCLEQIRSNNIKTQSIVIIQNWLISKKSQDLFNSYSLSIYSLAIFEALRFENNWNITRFTTPLWRQIKNDNKGIYIANFLSNSGIQTKASEDIETQRARKFIINCLVNWLSAIYNSNINTLFKNQRAVKQMDKIFDECYTILQLEEKYQLVNYDFEKDAAYNALKIRYWDHYPSLYQDIILKRKTEIEEINGFIIELWNTHWIPTPTNQWVYDEVKKIEDMYL